MAAIHTAITTAGGGSGSGSGSGAGSGGAGWLRDVSSAGAGAVAGPTAGTGLLRIADGRTGYAVEAAMWLLPPVPVFDRSPAGYGSGVPTAPGAAGRLWLLPLVDDRYWWWQRDGHWAAVSAPATWADLFAGLLDRCGVPAGLRSVAAVPAGYAAPSARWAVGAEPWPVLLDAAAASVGMRVARRPDGAVAVVTASTATATQTSNWAAWAADVTGGGRLSRYDLGRAVPERVAVVFGGQPADQSAVVVPLSSVPGAAGIGPGVAGATARVWPDVPASAGSGVRMAAASQAASDFYQWAVGPDVAATFRGTVPWVPGGCEGAVEWQTGACGDPHILTRVTCPPQPTLFGGSVPATVTTPNGSVVRLTAPNNGSEWSAAVLLGFDPFGELVDVGPVSVKPIQAGWTARSDEPWFAVDTGGYSPAVGSGSGSGTGSGGGSGSGSGSGTGTDVPGRRRYRITGRAGASVAIPDLSAAYVIVPNVAGITFTGSATCASDGTVTVTIGPSGTIPTSKVGVSNVGTATSKLEGDHLRNA